MAHTASVTFGLGTTTGTGSGSHWEATASVTFALGTTKFEKDDRWHIDAETTTGDPYAWNRRPMAPTFEKGDRWHIGAERTTGGAYGFCNFRVGNSHWHRLGKLREATGSHIDAERTTDGTLMRKGRPVTHTLRRIDR